MHRPSVLIRWCVPAVLVLCLSHAVAAEQGDALVPAAARQVLEATGVRGGLVVHVGCGDGRLTAALCAGDAYLVHGLDADAANVAKARDAIAAKGLYGKVSVDAFDGVHLPYVDNLVNLVVAEDLGSVPMAEVRRVLAPEGVAYIRSGGAWQKTIKPRPADIDDWTHFLHGPDNNPVAKDTVVGPPRRLQWWAGPRWCRSHEFISSFAAMVTGGGRIFYVFDEGLTGVTDPRLPERWTLIARDAFNGVLLWKRPLPEWRAGEWKSTALRNQPPSVARRLVTDGDRLYVTFGHEAGLSVLDPATGRTLREVEGTEAAQEMVLLDGTLVVVLAGSGERDKASGAIAAVDVAGGAIRWKAPAPAFEGQSLAADAGRVIYSTGKETVCLGLADGKERWRQANTDAKGRRAGAKTFVLNGDVVVEADAAGVFARSAETGEVLWTAPGGGRSMRGDEVFVAGGCVWRAAGDDIVGYDLATGKPKRTVDPTSVQTPGHHLRCYRGKATERYIITQWRGIEFISLTGAPHAENDWVRGPCGYGILPANGLLYAPPDPCFCFPGVKVPGFNALAPAAAEGDVPGEAVGEERLVKGPAYGAEPAGSASQVSDADWPTYRHDARRSGGAATTVPAQVAAQWTADLGGRLTAPVLAGGRLYVAAADRHTLYALAAADGSVAWRFTAGGPIDSPPTVCGGLVAFGCADGCVYALRVADGALAWRFRPVPSARRIVADGHLESPWPVHGSLLLKGGLLYGTAGRSTYLDGGIRLFALDPATGRAMHEARLDTASPTRRDAEGKPFVPAYHVEGALADVLASEGGHIYLGQYMFDLKLAEQPVPYVMPGPDAKPDAMRVAGQPYTDQDENPKADYETHQRQWLERTQKGLVAQLKETYGGWNMGDRAFGRHVFSTAGFLDDAWYNRTFWMYSGTWPGFYLAHRGAKTGQLLVVGPERTYAVQAYPSRNLQSPLFTPASKGYLLFADGNDVEPVLDATTRGTPKGWGFEREQPPAWFAWTPIRIRAMVLAGERLFVAGPPDVLDSADPMAAFEGRAGAVLRAVSASDGATLAEQRLDAPPVFDGLIAAGGRLYLATTDGKMLCFAGKE